MNTKSKVPPASVLVGPLTHVLGQTEQAKELVDQSASELSKVNTSLQREIGQEGPSSAIQAAWQKSQAVEEKVQDASGKLAAVTQALEVAVDERHQLNEKLAVATEQESKARHAAMHDALTGLPNRTLFDDRLEHGLAQARRLGLTLAVMFMDLDGFKAVNDRHGHDVGDALLQTVADRLKENTRDDDTVSRIGGDEFLYLAMGANDREDVAYLAQKIVHCIQAPCQLSAGTVKIKLSIGIACFPQDGDTAETLVKRADMAMYRAKRSQTDYVFAS